MRALASFLFTIFLYATPLAHAEDLFVDGLARNIKPLTVLSEGTTIGGYPLFDGGLSWRFLSSSTSTTPNFGIKFGESQLAGFKENSLQAIMAVAANLAQVSNIGYYGGNPCLSGTLPLLHKLDKSVRHTDNCLTIAPAQVKIDGKNQTFLAIYINNSQGNWRSYTLHLLILSDALGFPNSSVNDWTPESVANDPAKKDLLERLRKWAEKMQDSVNTAIGYNKPKDAFSGVPPISSLVVIP